MHSCGLRKTEENRASKKTHIYDRSTSLSKANLPEDHLFLSTYTDFLDISFLLFQEKDNETF